jgi:hypothetical protein
MTFDPGEIANNFREHANDWADKNAAADLLEHMRTVLRSQIASKFLQDLGSMNKAEAAAEATEEYSDHLKSMVEARRLANRARAQYEADKAYIDLIRSQESTRRAEMGLR